MKGDCFKKRYWSKEDAEGRLDDMQSQTFKKRRSYGNRTKKPPRGRAEKSAYKCPQCGFWHLTKQDGLATNHLRKN